MIWSLDREEWEKTLKRFEKMKRPPPESAVEPELLIDEVLYLRAYLDLQNDKTQFRSIPWTAVDRYAERYDIEGGQFEKLRAVVFEANSRVEEFVAERRESEAKFAESKRKAGIGK